METSLFTLRAKGQNAKITSLLQENFAKLLTQEIFIYLFKISKDHLSTDT